MASVQVNQMLAAAAAACEDKKAEDIRILALDPSESGLTDYFLICSGNSDRQNVAITDEVEMRLKKEAMDQADTAAKQRTILMAAQAMLQQQQNPFAQMIVKLLSSDQNPPEGTAQLNNA